MKWYADNSELRGLRESDIADVLLFGGIAVPSDEEELRLKSKVEEIKASYAHSRAPVKWNFRDLRKKYDQVGASKHYKALLNTSDEWRESIFDAIQQSDVTILVSCIEAYSTRRKVIKTKKESLSRHVFSNALMRFGLHVHESSSQNAQVILDWPDKGAAKPFNAEYAAAHTFGANHDNDVSYKCGRLRDLKMADSVLFTTMEYSTLLQVSDLIVGASREFVEWSLGKCQAGLGVECFSKVLANFRGAQDKILGRGFSVSTKNASLREAIDGGLDALQKSKSVV
jgi:hypothetical protein